MSLLREIFNFPAIAILAPQELVRVGDIREAKIFGVPIHHCI